MDPAAPCADHCADPGTDHCADFERAARLTRRRLLQGVAATGAVTMATTVFGDAFRQTAYGATPGRGSNVLVVLSLRGGVDGLGLVVPHGDPAYLTARPTVGVPTGSLLARDAMFGLHPAMAPLESAFTSGTLAAVHAVGLQVPDRSHFSAIEEVEDANPGSTVRRGWVNRMIGLETDPEPTDAVHLTASVPPTLLAGPAPTLAAHSINDVSLIGTVDDPMAARRRRQLDQMWAGGVGDPLYDAYRSAVRTVDVLAPVAAAPYRPRPGVTYPDAWPAGDLSAALKDTARLIKADLGTDVVSIDFGSWDMHSDYGTTEWGRMETMVGALASCLDAFLRDLGDDVLPRVTVVTISEFGRRIEENGNGGLDHGWGNVMLVAGGGVKGGRYYGQWPYLGDGRTPDDDLRVTTDYRDVFAEILGRRFPDRSLATVFPGLSPSPVGLMA